MRNGFMNIDPSCRVLNAPKLSLVPGVAILILLSGCANQSLSDSVAFSDTLAIQCPSGTVRQCELWGGNKFKKRYNRCNCADYR